MFAVSPLVTPSPHVGHWAKAGAADSMASATPFNVTFMILRVIENLHPLYDSGFGTIQVLMRRQTEA